MSKKISLIGSYVALGFLVFGFFSTPVQARPENKPDCEAGEQACHKVCAAALPNPQARLQCFLACTSGAFACEEHK